MSCLFIERRFLDDQAASFLARMALAAVPIIPLDLPITAKGLLAAMRGVGANTGWIVCADATVISSAATAGLAGVVLIGTPVPAGEHDVVVAEALSLSDAPRVMIPRGGGCWHEQRTA